MGILLGTVRRVRRIIFSIKAVSQPQAQGKSSPKLDILCGFQASTLIPAETMRSFSDAYGDIES